MVAARDVLSLSVSLALLVGLTSACGDDSATSSGEAGAPSSGQGGGASTGAAGSGGASTGTDTSTGTTTGSGAAPPDCAGDWTEPPATVFSSPEVLESPSSWRGGLELHGVISSFEGTATVVHLSRGTLAEPFPPLEQADSFTDVCAPGDNLQIDVSEDGLRLYATCQPYAPEVPELYACPEEGCAINLWERDAPSGPFAFARVLGLGGSHPSLRADERMVTTNGLGTGAPPLIGARDSIDDDFGDLAPLAVGVLDDLVTGAALSGDGLELYAQVRPPDGGPSKLGRATRSALDAPFSGFSPIDLWPSTAIALGAPDVSADCRSLYVVRVGDDGIKTIDVLQR